MLRRKSKSFRILSFLLAFLLVDNSLERVSAQPVSFVPTLPNHIVSLSVPFSSPVLRGMRVYPNKPFEFDFVVDSGNRRSLDRTETALLIKYFLTCLTVPREDLWVNLSPYESGHIIPEELGVTDAGRTLLEQDKLLKQMASSLTYPETELGKKFWDKVYKRAYQKFGTTNLPVNTYNKVWIVPDKAIVYDMGHSALIGETHLKVMLDEDYLASKKNKIIKDQDGLHQFTALVTKETILPLLEQEVNKGKNFAPVRQILYSMVLAVWFKRALKRSILSTVYVNKKKISGINGVDKKSKEEIYRQYLHLYRQGAYNYIREDVDPVSKQVLPRKYFSGGFVEGDPSAWMQTHRVSSPAMITHDFSADGNLSGVVQVKLMPIGRDPRYTSNAAQISSYKPCAHSASWKRHALMLAVAVGTSLGLSAVASASTKEASPKAVIHQSALRLGDNIQSSDRPFLKWLEDHIPTADVEALNDKTNPLTRRKYHVEVGSMQGAIDGALKKGKLDYKAQTYIYFLQREKGLSQDGQMGPITRAKIDELRQADLQARLVPANLVAPGSSIAPAALPQGSPAPAVYPAHPTAVASAAATRAVALTTTVTPGFVSLPVIPSTVKEPSRSLFSQLLDFILSSARAVPVSAIGSTPPSPPPDLFAPSLSLPEKFVSPQVTPVPAKGPLAFSPVAEALVVTPVETPGYVRVPVVSPIAEKKSSILSTLSDLFKSAIAGVSSRPASADVGSPPPPPLDGALETLSLTGTSSSAISRPSPQIVLPASSHLRLAPVYTSSVSIHPNDDRTFTGEGTLRTGEIEGAVVSSNAVIVTNIVPRNLKSEYQKGEVVASVIDLSLDNELKDAKAELKEALQELERQKNVGKPIADTVIRAERKVAASRAKLGSIEEKAAANKIIAQHHFRVIEIPVRNGKLVPAHAPIMRYVEIDDRVKLEFDISKKVSLDYIDFFINGKKVVKYEPNLLVGGSSDPYKDHLELIVTPAQAIKPGTWVKVYFKINHPPASFDTLAGITQADHPDHTVGVLVPPLQDKDGEITATASGIPYYYAQVGDLVDERQVVAVITNGGIDAQLATSSLMIKKNAELLESYEGDPGKTPLEKDQLRTENQKLRNKMERLAAQKGYLVIRASHKGRIIYSAQNGSSLGAVNFGDRMFKLNRGVYVLGDPDHPDSPSAVNFPYDAIHPEMKPEEMVLVQTDDNDQRLMPGRVEFSHPQPFSSKYGQRFNIQSVRLTVFDPTFSSTLSGTGRSVSIYMLKPDEQSQAAALLVSLMNGTSGNSAKPISKTRGTSRGDGRFTLNNQAMATTRREILQFSTLLALGVGSGCSHTLPKLKPQAPFVMSPEPQGPISLNLNEVAHKIAGNILTAPAEQIDVEIRKAMEEKPGAPVFNLSADIWRQGSGKVSFEGGIGFMMNSLQGTLSTGNALGLAIPFVMQGVGQLIDLITGRIGKQKDLARIMTKVAFHHLKTKLDGKVYEAQDLLISLKEAQERKKELKDLLETVTAIESDTLDRSKPETGTLSAMDYLKAKSERISVEQEILKNEVEIQKRTVALHGLIGSSTANTPIIANVSLTEDIPFSSLEDQIKDALLLIGRPDQSPNPQMQELVAILEAAKINFDLDWLGYLPSFNAGVVGSTQDTKDTIYDAWSGTWMHTSATQKGANAIVQGNWAVFDKGREIETTRVSLEVVRAYTIIEATRRDIAVRLMETQLNINYLRELEKNAQEAYEIADRLYKITSDTRHYVSLQSLDPLLARYRAQQELDRIHAQYSREKARLRQLGLFKYGEPLARANQAMIAASRKPWTSILQKLVFMLTLTFTPLSALAQQMPEGNTLALAGQSAIDTSVRSRPGSAIDNLFNDLGDADLDHRMQGIRGLFSGKYEQNNNYWNRLQEAILANPYPDVQRQILRNSVQSSLEGKDPTPNLKFFVRVIHRSAEDRNEPLHSLALKYLGDLLEARPGLLNILSSHIGFEKSDDDPNISPEIAEAILLTFWVEPINPAVRDLLTEGDSLHFVTLGQKRKQLILAAKEENNKGSKAKMENTAGVLRNAIKRQEASINRRNAFIPAAETPLRWLNSFLGLFGLNINLEDAQDKVEGEEWEVENYRGLNGEIWQDVVKNKGHLKSDLDSRAEEDTQEVIDTVHLSVSDGKDPLFYSYQPPNDSDDVLNSFKLREAYIASAKDYPELARLLRKYPELRDKTLMQLKTSSDWVWLVLQAYVDAGNSPEDKNFTAWVEKESDSGINWETQIDAALRARRQSMLKDIQKKDSEKSETRQEVPQYLTKDRLIRAALAKMFSPGHQGTPGLRNLWYRNLSIHELSKLSKQGNKQADGFIEFSSWEWALRALKAQYRWSLWGGAPELEAPENRTLTRIANILRQNNDPLVVKGLLEKDPLDAKVLKSFRDISAAYSKDMKDNYQRVAHFSNWYVFLMKAIGGAVSLFIAGSWLRKHLKRQRGLVRLGRAWWSWLHEPIKKVSSVLTKINGKEKAESFETMMRQFESGTGLDVRASESLQGTAAIIPVKGSLQQYAPQYLKSWHQLLVKWSSQPNGDIDWSYDLNTALKLAENLIIALRYNPDMIKEADSWNALSIDQYRRSLYYFFNYSAWTLHILSQHLRQVSDGQKQRLTLAIDKMIQYMTKAVISFVSPLDKTTAIDGVIKEVDQDWFEKIGGRRTLRKGLYQQSVLDVSQEIPEEIGRYLDQMDQLFPGLYWNRALLKTQTKERLDEIMKEGKSPRAQFSKVQGDGLRKGNTARRNVFGISFFVTLWSLFNGDPSVWATVSTWISMRAFKFQAKAALSKQTIDLMGEIVEKLRVECHLPRDGIVSPKKLAEQEGKAQRDIEMKLDKPRVPKFVISVQDPRDVMFIRSQLADLKIQGYIRPDVFPEIKTPEDLRGLKGSGNAIFEMVNGPGAYILYGKNSTYPNNPEPLRMAILNAYRAAANGAEASIIYAKKPYFGEIRIPQGSDMAFMLSRAPGKNLHNEALIMIDPSSPDVERIYENVHLDDPSSQKVRSQLIEQGLPIDNKFVSMYPVLGGLIAMKLSAINTLKAKGVETADLRPRLPGGVRLLEILEVLRRKNDEKIFSFLQRRWLWPDFEGVGKFLVGNRLSKEAELELEFYRTINQQEHGRMNIDGYDGDAADAAQIAHNPNVPGGIDLNFQPQFVDQPGSLNLLAAQEAALAHVSGRFQGFNFNIVRFIPQPTIHSAVQWMFDSNSG